MDKISIKETSVEATRRFIDKKTNMHYHGNEVVWVVIKKGTHVLQCGYFLIESRKSESPDNWVRVEPHFKKVKHRVPKVIFVQKPY